jgi:hypothetical protein
MLSLFVMVLLMPRPPRLPTSEEAYSKNTKEQYEELGRFVEMFELMVNEARESCIDLLSKDSDHRELVQIAFHHQSLTAKSLFEIMRAIITEVIKDQAHFHYNERISLGAILGQVQSAYDRLANMRNNLLHGTWFVGFTNETDPEAETFYLRKYTTSAQGFTELTLPKKAENLRRLRTDCDAVRTWIALILFCLQDQTKIADYFEQRDGTWFLINLYPTPQPLPDKWQPA